MTILFTRVKKVIDQLTDPQAHVVIPTIPGFGLSSPVEETGWQSVRTARAYAELMQRLGKERVKQMQAEWDDDMGYLKIQSTRPLTIGYGLNGSPIAQLAWQVEKYKAWTNPAMEVPELLVGDIQKFFREL